MAPVVNLRNLYNNVFNTKFVKNLLPVNPTAKQAANLALISTLTKDAFGCVVYTHQSFNNMEIPDSKRNFVTALDFSNGISNVFIPMITGPLLSKNSDKLFEKWFGKHFDDAACERMHEKLSRNGIKSSLDSVKKVVSKQGKNWGKAGFGVITMLVYSQILVKRILTPTISTSMADVFKGYVEKLDDKRKAKQAESLKEANSDSILVAKSEKSDKSLDSESNESADITGSKKQTPVKSSIYVMSSPFTKFDDMVLQNKK